MDLRDLLIQAEFNIRPGDSTEWGLVVNMPHVKRAIGKYLNTGRAKRLMSLIELSNVEAQIDAFSNIVVEEGPEVYYEYEDSSRVDLGVMLTELEQRRKELEGENNE